MKKRLLIVPALLILVGCDDLPNTSSGSSSAPPPGVVQMRFLGTAQAGPGEPINGCRVYGYTLNGDTQTAIICGNKVTVASGKKKSDDGGGGGTIDDD